MIGAYRSVSVDSNMFLASVGIFCGWLIDFVENNMFLASIGMDGLLLYYYCGTILHKNLQPIAY